MMALWNRQRKQARASSHTRRTNPLILVIHEGQKTEPEYLMGLKQECRNQGLYLKLVKSEGNPENYVSKAIQERNTFGDDLDELDEVWCVFDQDHHSQHQLNKAKAIADANDIKLAISIPCIEVWLYLHFKDDPGSGSTEDIRKKLAKKIPNYDKGINFKKHYKYGYYDAVERSKIRLNSAEADGDPWRNPSTGMHLLCESIRRDFEFYI